jgi:hypothetical protein
MRLAGDRREDTMTGPARLRAGSVLSAQLSALSAEGERTGNPFVRGASNALRWLIEGGPGPLTSTLETPIPQRAVVHELAAAEAVIYGPPTAQRDYARGVEHALMWAQFATACPPAPPAARLPSESTRGIAGRPAPGQPQTRMSPSPERRRRGEPSVKVPRRMD